MPAIGEPASASAAWLTEREGGGGFAQPGEAIPAEDVLPVPRAGEGFPRDDGAEDERRIDPEAGSPRRPDGGAIASSTAAVLVVTALEMIRPRTVRFTTAQKPAPARPITGQAYAVDLDSFAMTECAGATLLTGQRCPAAGVGGYLDCLLQPEDLD